MLTLMPLAATADALRTDQLDLFAYINEVCERIDASEPQLQVLLPEQGRRTRLLAEARALQELYPDPSHRPPLYGCLFGVKDLFFVDGFATRAGSQLPQELFAGPEASCVATLRAAGALILGKTVSAEFAYFEPGPTRNPRNHQHTPGGSSSGSAAAVAAGYCPLALGTQTIGSTIRPAAFCGIVGFKPTYGRIYSDGLVACAPSLDTVGLFTQDVEGAALVAVLLCRDWQPVHPTTRPVLGVPDGPYLVQASAEGLAAFEAQLKLLENAGYIVRHVPALEDIETINMRNMRIVFAEMAQIHEEWFVRYESLYRSRTSAAIRDGQQISKGELTDARKGQAMLRAELLALMEQHALDLWVCPAAPGPAPEGIHTTGNPIMNLPWSYAGLPALTLPAGFAAHDLPLGLQCVGAAWADEYLLAWAAALAEILVPA